MEEIISNDNCLIHTYTNSEHKYKATKRQAEGSSAEKISTGLFPTTAMAISMNPASFLVSGNISWFCLLAEVPFIQVDGVAQGTTVQQVTLQTPPCQK